MNIVIVTALPPEFNAARNELGLSEITTKRDVPRIAQGAGITLILTGMGRDSAYNNLKEVLDQSVPDLIIDTGTCGSLVDEVNIGDIVYSREVLDISDSLELNEVVEINNTTMRDIISNVADKVITISSVDKSITDSAQRESLRMLGAHVVTWESIGVFRLAQELGIPVFSVRGVTDCCNGDTFKDFKRNRLEVCKKVYNSVKILCKGI